jgi:hypothetical protein
MARMIAEVYQAFKAVDDDTAKAAATALAQRDDEFHEIKSEMRLLNWKVNAVLGHHSRRSAPLAASVHIGCMRPGSSRQVLRAPAARHALNRPSGHQRPVRWWPPRPRAERRRVTGERRSSYGFHAPGLIDTASKPEHASATVCGTGLAPLSSRR